MTEIIGKCMNCGYPYSECICAKNEIPHTCPVCGGNGLVPNGFYNQTSGQWVTTVATPETCRSCKGIGYVWKL